MRRRIASILLLLLLAAAPAFGAPSRTLPASYTENTYCTSGCDYSVLATWEAATDVDLTGTGFVLTVSAGTYDDRVTAAGATNYDATHFRVIRSASSIVRPVFSYSGSLGVTASGAVIQVGNYNDDANHEEYFKVYDLEITHTGASTGNFSGILFNQGSTQLSSYGVADGCYIRDLASASYSAFGVNANGRYSVIVNCIGDSNKTANFSVYRSGNVFYNCTSYGSALGFRDQGGNSPVAKNCISESGTTRNWSNTDGTGAGTWVKTTCTDGAGVQFVNAAANDFELKSTDTAAKGQGTNLSADATFPFTDDYAGSTRVVPWDIGAWKYTAGQLFKKIPQVW